MILVATTPFSEKQHRAQFLHCLRPHLQKDKEEKEKTSQRMFFILIVVEIANDAQ